MEEISNDYEEITDTAIDNMIARFEPTIVAVLAVSVGLVLLSVMPPSWGCTFCHFNRKCVREHDADSEVSCENKSK